MGHYFLDTQYYIKWVTTYWTHSRYYFNGSLNFLYVCQDRKPANGVLPAFPDEECQNQISMASASIHAPPATVSDDSKSTVNSTKGTMTNPPNLKELTKWVKQLKGGIYIFARIPLYV